LREVMKYQAGFLKKGNVSIPQMIILELLNHQKECTMGDITKSIGITKAGATGQVDKMVKDRLVWRRRLHGDRRVVVVFLTAKGARMAKQIADVRKKGLEKIFSYLKDAERKEYLRLIKKMHAGLTEKGQR
jgi:DNA-binding MarR family transcriptional regulator